MCLFMSCWCVGDAAKIHSSAHLINTVRSCLESRATLCCLTTSEMLCFIVMLKMITLSCTNTRHELTIWHTNKSTSSEPACATVVKVDHISNFVPITTTYNFNRVKGR